MQTFQRIQQTFRSKNVHEKMDDLLVISKLIKYINV